MGGSLLVRGAEREGHKQDMEERIRLIPKEVETHYLQSREWQRLSGDRGELERLRTQAILGRSLPPAPAVVLDVGGAAGVYAFPWCGKTFHVGELAREYRFSDIDGRRVPPFRIVEPYVDGQEVREDTEETRPKLGAPSGALDQHLRRCP